MAGFRNGKINVTELWKIIELSYTWPNTMALMEFAYIVKPVVQSLKKRAKGITLHWNMRMKNIQDVAKIA